MESPGKKFTDLVEIESIQDTDLAVVRNDTGVKKTPMQKLSDYIKQKFIGWVFSDLPTTDKTIPGALKELNSALNKFGTYNVSKVLFGYDENTYYIEFEFSGDNKYRLFTNTTGIAFSRWDGSTWEELWSCLLYTSPSPRD